jgi:hypothetical protein
VIDLQTTLQEHLFDVAVAERVAQVPGDSLDDEGASKHRPLKSPRAWRFSLRALRLMGRLRIGGGKLGE